MPQKLATDGSKYWTGLIGMNNIKHNDYINVVIQGLAQVPKFRDHFLVRTFAGNKQTSDRIMLRRLGKSILVSAYALFLNRLRFFTRFFTQEAERSEAKSKVSRQNLKFEIF